MGTETEYGLSGLHNGKPVLAEEVYSLLFDAVRKERLTMPDVIGGSSIYLENGGRLYMDSGGHPEYATPESLTPAQVAAYDKAGEWILERARERVQHERPQLRVSLLKCNISPIFPDRFTFGCHESHTSWVSAERAAPQLLPHLVSRTIFAGAGCLSAHPNGVGFELSQRARHMVQVVGSDTTCNRPLFGTRIRKATDCSPSGWVRIHLICKDSHRAPLGIYLTFGTTGLLFQLINQKKKVGKGLELADPLAALRAIALDPWLRVRVPLVDGRQLTAIEIQEAYLAECDREVQKGEAPEWAGEVLRHWRETLYDLKKDPLRLAGRLDPYCKLLIFDHELNRAGCGWSDLHRGLVLLARLRDKYASEVIRALLAESPHLLPAEQQPQFSTAAAEAEIDSPGVADLLRLTVRLQAIDFHYHELGGLYDRLAAAGKVQDVVLDRADIERASREAPPGGRAAVRAAWIKTQRQSDWVCDWRYVYDYDSQTFVDLRNPFAGDGKVSKVSSPPEDDTMDDELHAILARLQAG
jgi:proteasome accessory factor A